MERVAFIVDATGERIDCLLNPETFDVTRLAGIGVSDAGDDAVRFTGGGRTELLLDLLFDVALVESRVPPQDVRHLTAKLWNLAENAAQEHGTARPPLVRLVWGRSWNVPGVISAIAERFDAFGPTGVPGRSWLRLKLVRVDEPEHARAGAVRTPGTAIRFSPALTSTGSLSTVDGDAAVRQALQLLLATTPGERLMRPRYGCHLDRLRSAPNNHTTAGLAVHYVRQAVQRWEPRAEIVSLDAAADPDVATRLTIQLRYRVRATHTTAVLDIPLDLGPAADRSPS